jgi:hypothetical protein
MLCVDISALLETKNRKRRLDLSRRFYMSSFRGFQLLIDAMELNATVFGPTISRLITGFGLGVAESLGHKPVGVKTLLDKVSLNRVGTHLRQFLVPLVAVGVVGMSVNL